MTGSQHFTPTTVLRNSFELWLDYPFDPGIDITNTMTRFSTVTGQLEVLQLAADAST